VTAIVHALTIDVEDWFQVLNLRHVIRREDWDQMPLRCIDSTRRILELLARHGARATFFCLGWIAERAPQLVAEIAAAGHEIASHGYDHQCLHDLGEAAFRAELRRTRDILVAITAKPVEGFRACTWSVTRRTPWALPLLRQEGVRFDSSIFPVSHPEYGIPDALPVLHRRATSAGELLEFPPLTLRLLGRNLAVGGGGYLRLLPTALCAWALRRAERAGTPGCVYLHPWEFDPDQPRVGVTGLKAFRHYVNLRRTHDKLAGLLRRFRFGTMSEAIRSAGPLPLSGEAS
jgi:polysaccharide deacetylase family protein (PEP-CTERM system associated)